MFDNLSRMVSGITLEQALEKADSAQRLGDRKSEALHRLLAAKIHLEASRPGEAFSQATAALGLFQSLGNLIGEASAILVTAQAEYLRGSFLKAQSLYETALAKYSRSGDQTGEALAHLGLAAVHFDNPVGRNLPRAREHLTKASAIYQRLGDWESLKTVKDMLSLC